MTKTLMATVSALAICAMTSTSFAASMDDLVAAAKKEGTLTTIALPHDWCGYGAVIDGFKAKYPGIAVNELNPDAGSADEVEAIRANKGNTGPQAPDVIDVGLSFGPLAKKEGLIQPYKVATWDTIPDSAKDADGYWYGDYYGVMSFVVNKDIIKNTPTDWPDLLGGDFKNAVALAGDPRASNQATQGVYAVRCRGGRRGRRRGRQQGPQVLRRAQQGGQLRAGHRQGRLAGPGLHARHHRAGTTTRSHGATASTAIRRSTSSFRRAASSRASMSRRSAPSRRIRTRPSCGWSTSIPTKASCCG